MERQLINRPFTTLAELCSHLHAVRRTVPKAMLKNLPPAA
jgi:hypothetical protein